jgi:hypothetical protein
MDRPVVVTVRPVVVVVMEDRPVVVATADHPVAVATADRPVVVDMEEDLPVMVDRRWVDRLVTVDHRPVDLDRRRWEDRLARRWDR